MKCPDQANSLRQKVEKRSPEAGRGRDKWGVTTNGYGVFYWVMKMLWNQILDSGNSHITLYIYMKNH